MKKLFYGFTIIIIPYISRINVKIGWQLLIICEYLHNEIYNYTARLYLYIYFKFFTKICIRKSKCVKTITDPTKYILTP